ncbi:TolC family outer membrane protein [Methylibium rhizosphaerae]|uniref:TolC family outer membrane protein n=1 Tax=Methylibium rhizosphaerae TaxID=2570323 RepID=UPI001127FD7C|nr:TolC family outer membrane protein [Methylibium rhizosphaerae]
MPAAIRLPALSRLMLACATAFGAASAAQAQSLAELYEAARGYDATYLAARAVAESAQYRAEQAHARRRPKIDATLNAARSANEQPNVSAAGETTLRSTSAAITASQSLFNRATDVEIEQADKGVESAQADLQVAEQDLIVRVAQAYFDVLAAQDALAREQANKKGISEQLASAKRNFEVGTATITDTREAQARFDLATAQEIAATNDLQTKRIALDQLIGRTGVAPRPLATPVALPPVSPTSVDEWVASAEQAPGVRKARVGYEVTRLETERARAGHLPTVGLNASYTKGHNNVRFEPAAGGSLSASGPLTQSTIGVTVNIPLFAGFATQNRIRETLLLEEQARNNLEAVRRTVAQSTRQVFFGVQSGQAQVQALEAAEASSKLALEATQLGYRVGVRVNLDVLNAQTQLFTTQRDLAKARYDVVVNSLRLRQAAGTLNPGDVNAVNQLIAR